jgi:predicted dinucleotide-binding enzyme
MPALVSSAQLPRIAVLGAGHSGPVIARVAMEAGYPVPAADAVAVADIVILAIPLHKFTTLEPSLVAEKLVVDVMNSWPAVDGVVPMFEGHQHGSSEIVQRRLAASTVVKALNHIGYHELDDERRPAGSPDRRALGVAGDDQRALTVVADLVERIGYDAVRLDRLRAGRILEPGGPVFGVSLRLPEFEQGRHRIAA